MATGFTLPVQEIAKAVSGAVTFVLSKLQDKGDKGVESLSSGDEFQNAPPLPKRKKKSHNKK